MSKLILMLALFSIFLSKPVYADEDQIFEGICTIASVSKEKGIQGLHSAKPISQEKFYRVIGNKEVIQVEWEQSKITYRRHEVEGKFSTTNSLIIYKSQSNDEVWLIIPERRTNINPIFHTGSSDGRNNTWGGCALKWTSNNSPLLLQQQIAPELLERLKKENYAKLNRATSGGNLTACEFIFNYSYLDRRSLRGLPVIITGSFNMMTNKGKLPVYSLKIDSFVMDTENLNWKLIKPAFSTIIINNRNFDLNKTLEHTCESGGRCVAYGDTNLSLLDTIVSKPLLNAEILVSLQKDGIDHKFSLSDLARLSKNGDDLFKFNQCAFEILDQTLKNLSK